MAANLRRLLAAAHFHDLRSILLRNKLFGSRPVGTAGNEECSTEDRELQFHFEAPFCLAFRVARKAVKSRASSSLRLKLGIMVPGRSAAGSFSHWYIHPGVRRLPTLASAGPTYPLSFL